MFMPRSIRASLLVLTLLAIGVEYSSAQLPAMTASSAPFPGPGGDAGVLTFQKRVDEVNLLFTVVDNKGRFISKLQLEDFQLLDDRRSPEKIRSFQQESDLPLRVALVIDLSGSVTPRFKFEQKAA